MGFSVEEKAGNKSLGSKKIRDLVVGDCFEWKFSKHGERTRTLMKVANSFEIVDGKLGADVIPEIDPEIVVTLVPRPRTAM
jgi:hypothetical protein